MESSVPFGPQAIGFNVLVSKWEGVICTWAKPRGVNWSLPYPLSMHSLILLVWLGGLLDTPSMSKTDSLLLLRFYLIKQINLETLWGTAASGGWRPSSAPRSDWPRKEFQTSWSICLHDFWIMLKYSFFLCNLLMSISAFLVVAAPPKVSNGYLRVRCNGGLNQQRTAVCIPCHKLYKAVLT